MQRQQELNSTEETYHGPVVVLGATNRPQDLDAAFLRRMPVKLSITVPDDKARLAILRTQLRSEDTSSLDLQAISEAMPGCTGADIKELIRLACLQRTKELTALAQKALLEEQANPNGPKPMMEFNRLLTQADFDFALQKVLKRGTLPCFLHLLCPALCLC